MATEVTCATSFETMLEQRGVTRRDFMKLCAGVAATLGLSQAMVPQIAYAIEDSVIGKETGKLTPVIWLELASCTGCTESFAQANNPDAATVVLELISLNYSETLSAGAGHSLELAKEQTIEAGGYLLLVEGALMEGWDGNALRIGWDGTPETFEQAKGTKIVEHAASNAAAIVCTGSCASDGGWQAAHPNPGGAIGVQAYLEKAKANGEFDFDIPPIINIPCCPSNPEHVVAVLVDVLLLDTVPELNEVNAPKFMFSQLIHDNCPRRGHFENGEFVYKFGSEEEKKGYCLYAVGCKGPQTKSDCPKVRWNRGLNWCVEAGAPCIGCATINPMKSDYNWVELNAPFLSRFKTLNINGLHVDPTHVAFGVGGLAVAALVAHGFGMKLTGRTKGGAPFETERKWDTKHPEKALCTADAAKTCATAQHLEQAAEKDAKSSAKSSKKSSAKGGDK
ncbi:MAG: hydrogenase small subunit [Coriobacteriia bacterium]|nr:hydrogenase small subunit [Coriobacteriia bacterium]